MLQSVRKHFTKNSYYTEISQLTCFAMKDVSEQAIILSHKTLISQGIAFQWLSVVCSETHSFQLSFAIFIFLGVNHCEVHVFWNSFITSCEIFLSLIVIFACYSFQNKLAAKFTRYTLERILFMGP